MTARHRFPATIRFRGRPVPRTPRGWRGAGPAVAVLVALLAVGSCSEEGEEPVGGAAPQASAGPGRAVVEQTWVSSVRAVEPPQAAAGSVVFHAFSSSRTFEVASLDPGTGKVRWTAPASPSVVAPGVGLGVVLVDGGRVVVWMEPSGNVSDGTVSVVAADTETGRRLWSYGAGALYLPSSPSACRDDRAICLTARVPGVTTYRRFVLDGTTGRVLSQADLPGEFSRELGANLHDEDTRLTALTEEGSVRWSKPYSVVFTGLDVDADYGWNVELKDDSYVATLGYVNPEFLEAATTSTPRSVDAARLGASAAFSAATGDTLWLRPDASLFCGQLPFDIDHPVRCVFRGTAQFDGSRLLAPDVDVTVEGFDVQSGRTTWTWHAGAVEGLVISEVTDERDTEVLRIDDVRYLVRTGGQATLLDLDRGPVPGTPPAAGWCNADAAVDPSFRISGYEDADGYRASGWHPCSADGPVPLPASVPDFAGARFGDVYVWQDDGGYVRAGRVG